MSEACGHNSYWTTAYQKCVMCENATLRARIAELEQDKDEWKSRHTELKLLIEQAQGEGAGFYGSMAGKAMARLHKSEQKLRTRYPKLDVLSSMHLGFIEHATTLLLHDLAAVTAERDLLLTARKQVWDEVAQLIEGYQLPNGWKMARLDEKDATTAWLQRIISRCREQAQAALARQKSFDGSRFEQAPCYLCGYSNGGYYQPEQHPCAARYHAWVEAQP